MAIIGINKNVNNEYVSSYIIMRDTYDEKIFQTGNLTNDWTQCTKYFFKNYEEHKETDLKTTEDVIQYIVNSNEYDVMNFILNNTEIEITYNEIKDGFKKYFIESGWFIPIKKGTKPTMEELKIT